MTMTQGTTPKMGMRIIWGLFNNETDTIIATFEAENLLVAYREQLLRKWYDDATRPLPVDSLPQDELGAELDAQYDAERERLLDLGWERWRNDEINSTHPLFQTQKYELWNSVPPNPERLVIHFDS